MAVGARRASSRQLLPVLGALALGVSLAAGFTGGASATTQPGFVFKLNVVMTDSQILLVPKATKTGKYLTTYFKANGLSARFPRGVLVQFLFTNKGTKTYVPAIRVTNKSEANPSRPRRTCTTAMLVKPGGHATMFGNFYFRGSFEIQKLLNKKPSASRSVSRSTEPGSSGRRGLRLRSPGTRLPRL